MAPLGPVENDWIFGTSTALDTGEIERARDEGAREVGFARVINVTSIEPRGSRLPSASPGSCVLARRINSSPWARSTARPARARSLSGPDRCETLLIMQPLYLSRIKCFQPPALTGHLISHLALSHLGDMDIHDPSIYVTLGQRIAERRKAQGLTQVQLADTLGVSQQATLPTRAASGARRFQRWRR